MHEILKKYNYFNEQYKNSKAVLFFSDTFKTLQTCMAGISGVCEGNAIYDMTKQSLQGLEAICSGTGKCATMNNNLEVVGVS